MLWAAVLAIIASTANNIGKAVQKKASRSLPVIRLEHETLKEYFGNGEWVRGLAADVLGALLMAVAFSGAPVSVLQPLSGVGMVSLALYSHYVLKEKLSNIEWFAAALACIGAIGLGASSQGGKHSPPTSNSFASIMFWVFLVTLMLFLSEAYISRKVALTKLSAESVGVCYGLVSGGFFAMSAIITRIGFILSPLTTLLLVPLCIVCSIISSGQGIMCQTKGFKKASSVSVCSASSTSSQIVGVLMGLLVLGEPMPHTLLGNTLRVLSWGVLGVGVTLLASGPDGAKTIVEQLFKWIDYFLPRKAGIKLRSFSQSLDLTLPKVKRISSVQE